jgi:hypothetical protein
MPLDNTQIAELVATSKESIQRNTDRLLNLLTFVPDDKLHWSPSSTAKTPLRIVAHCAVASGAFTALISGNMPDPMPPAEALIETFNAAEQSVSTREAAIAMTKQTSDDLCKALEGVNEANIDAVLDSPFGPMPLTFWIHVCSSHMMGHIGQLEYVQTIWGDLDNHRD